MKTHVRELSEYDYDELKSDCANYASYTLCVQPHALCRCLAIERAPLLECVFLNACHSLALASFLVAEGLCFFASSLPRSSTSRLPCGDAQEASPFAVMNYSLSTSRKPDSTTVLWRLFLSLGAPFLLLSVDGLAACST